MSGTMHIVDGGSEGLTVAGDAAVRDAVAKGQKKLYAGGWLALKPPYGLRDYFHNTSTNDPVWCERKGIRRIWPCRIRGIERDLEPALRAAAGQAKGLAREERQHLLDAADECVRVRASRAEKQAMPVESEHERLMRTFAEAQASGQGALVEALKEALSALTGGKVETTDEQPARKK